MLSGQELARAIVVAMERKDVGTNEVARHFGIKSSSVSEWRSTGKVAKDKIAKLIDYFSDVVGPDHWGLPHLANVNNPSQAITAYDPEDPLPDGLLQIKVSNVRFSGGNGHTATHCEIDETSEPHTYQRSWFVRERLKPERCIRYRLKNNSMEPLLYHGDWILVNLDETSVVDGCVYAFRYGDELRVKKLQRRLNGGLVLISINPDYRPEEVSPEDVAQHITIIGRVRDKGGRGGL